MIGAEGDPARAANAPTARAEIRLWTAAVLRQMPEEPLQPVPLGDVHMASDADVALALRMDAYLHGARPTAIPVGLYTSGGLEAPVYLDADFLLGPEAAHLNISGVSGLATKTSAVEFLLGALFQHFPPHRGKIAAVCFNVKGPDLLFLDQPGRWTTTIAAATTGSDVDPAPFEQVRYYAPFKADGVNLNTLRTHGDLVGAVEPLVWGLTEVLDFAEVLLNRDDIDAKADAFIDFLADRVVRRDFDDGFGGQHHVETFADLERLFRSIFDGLENAGRGDIWRTHHIATIRKVRNRLGNVSTRCKGLVTDDGPSSDLPLGRFEDRAVYVIDVANVDPLGQDLVFARVVSKLREHLERRDLGVDAVVGVRGRAEQVRPGGRRRDVREEDAARHLGAWAVPRASCCSAPSSSVRRCTGGWWGTRARRCSAGWTPTSWRRRGTRCSRPRPRSSSPRCRWGS